MQKILKISLAIIIAVLVAGLAMVATPATAQTQSCLEQLKWNSDSMPFPAIVNTMDTGSDVLYTLTYAEDGMASKFVALVKSGKKLTFESIMIVGKQILTNDPGLAKCAGDELAVNTGAYKLYVGDDNAPNGWSKIYPDGWVMHTFDYPTTSRVENPYPANWADTSWKLDVNHELKTEAGWLNGQFWNGIKGGSNPGDGSKPFHVIAEPNCTITMSDKLQGTSWNVSGTGVKGEMIVPFFVQMNNDSAIEYGSTPVKLFVGNGTPPAGYSKDLPSGWTASCDQPAPPTQSAPVPPVAPVTEEPITTQPPVLTVTPPVIVVTQQVTVTKVVTVTVGVTTPAAPTPAPTQPSNGIFGGVAEFALDFRASWPIWLLVLGLIALVVFLVLRRRPATTVPAPSPVPTPKPAPSPVPAPSPAPVFTEAELKSAVPTLTNNQILRLVAGFSSRTALKSASVNDIRAIGNMGAEKAQLVYNYAQALC